MRYFAYGSNLCRDQMQERCPSARFVDVAKLAGHRLVFSRRSAKRGCGVADVVVTHGHDVWGVVYDIPDPDDEQELDRCEGVPHSYVRESHPVFLRNNPETSVTAQIYFAVKERNPPLPNAQYKKLIVEGAKFWQLPFDYIHELEEIVVASV